MCFKLFDEMGVDKVKVFAHIKNHFSIKSELTPSHIRGLCETLMIFSTRLLKPKPQRVSIEMGTGQGRAGDPIPRPHPFPPRDSLSMPHPHFGDNGESPFPPSGKGPYPGLWGFFAASFPAYEEKIPCPTVLS